jgi:hypothetical protein
MLYALLSRFPTRCCSGNYAVLYKYKYKYKHKYKYMYKHKYKRDAGE